MHLSSKWIEENRWPNPPIATTAIAITESNCTAAGKRGTHHSSSNVCGPNSTAIDHVECPQ